MTNITQSEIDIAVEILQKLEPGVLPFEIFHQFARLYVTPIIEVIPLRKNQDGKIKIILLEREKDDPVWPGKLNTPGTVLRASDKEGDFSDAFDRIIKDELGGLEIVHGPEFITYEFHKVKRGMELGLVFFIEHKGEPIKGIEVDIDNLPETIIPTQLKCIGNAISAFKKYSEK